MLADPPHSLARTAACWLMVRVPRARARARGGVITRNQAAAPSSALCILDARSTFLGVQPSADQLLGILAAPLERRHGQARLAARLVRRADSHAGGRSRRRRRCRRPVESARADALATLPMRLWHRSACPGGQHAGCLFPAVDAGPIHGLGCWDGQTRLVRGAGRAQGASACASGAIAATAAAAGEATLSLFRSEPEARLLSEEGVPRPVRTKTNRAAMRPELRRVPGRCAVAASATWSAIAPAIASTAAVSAVAALAPIAAAA